MSRKNSLNHADAYLYHRKEPIHFYTSNRGSSENIQSTFSHLGLSVSPNKYLGKNISPIKSGQLNSLNRSPEISIKVDRVLNPSFPSNYNKFRTKIDLL